MYTKKAKKMLKKEGIRGSYKADSVAPRYHRIGKVKTTHPHVDKKVKSLRSSRRKEVQ